MWTEEFLLQVKQVVLRLQKLTISIREVIRTLGVEKPTVQYSLSVKDVHW